MRSIELMMPRADSRPSGDYPLVDSAKSRRIPAESMPSSAVVSSERRPAGRSREYEPSFIVPTIVLTIHLTLCMPDAISAVV